MDEARRVMERLERIERLRRVEGSPRALLAEVRGLLEDGEAWLAAEGRDADVAAAALGRCRQRLDAVGEVRPEQAATGR